MLLLLTGTAATTRAENFVVDTFDHDIAKWAGLAGTLTFDPARDNTGNGGGSCRVTADFVASQNMIFVGTYGPGGFSESNMLLYLSTYGYLDFDVKWDTNSSMSLADFNRPPSGGYSPISIQSVKPNWSGWSDAFGSFTIPDAATSGWVRISIPINPTTPGLDPSQGLWFQKWIQSGSGTANFWLDNVQLICVNCGIPPPFLQTQKAVPGLNLFAGSPYPSARQSIRTVSGWGPFSWVGNGQVSYSFTVNSFNAVTTNFQMHLFLVPNADDSTAPDWYNPDVLAALLLPQADGSVVWRVQAKTNCTGSCAWQVYGLVTNASPLGTWSLNFADDTNLTLTTPDGHQITVTLPAELAARFADPLSVYFGVMTGDFGRSVTLSHVQISGSQIMTLQDDFSAGLDTNLWEVIAAYPPSVQPVPANAWWLMWTSLDTGFVLATNSNLANPGGWGTNQLPVAVQLGPLNYALLTTNAAYTTRPIAFPANGSLFFRMQRR